MSPIGFMSTIKVIKYYDKTSELTKSYRKAVLADLHLQTLIQSIQTNSIKFLKEIISSMYYRYTQSVWTGFILRRTKSSDMPVLLKWYS